MNTMDRSSVQSNASSASSPEPLWRSFGNWRKPHFWVLAGFISYSLAGFLGLPWLLESMLASRFADIGRSAQVEDIRFNPYTLELEIDELAINDQDRHPLLSFSALRVNFQSSSLLHWALTFKEISLRGLSIDEERFAGLDTRFTRLVNDLTPPGEPPPEPEPLPRLIITRLSIDDASLGFTDQETGGYSTRFGPVSAVIEDLRTLPEHSGQQSVKISTTAGGTIQWQGSIQMVPFASAGSLQVSGKALGDATRYAEHYLPFRVLGESIEIGLDYEFMVDQAGAKLAVENLNAKAQDMGLARTGQDTAVIASRIITLTDGRLRWPEQEFSAARLLVDGLSVDAVLLADGSIDLMQLVPDLPEQPDDPASDPEPWLIELDAFDLTGAALSVTDQGISPAVQLALNDITLGMQRLDNREHTSMPLQMELELASGGKVAFAGEVTALPDLTAEGALTLDQLQVTAAQPYVQQLANVAIGSGALSMQAQLSHAPDQLLALAGSLDLDTFELKDLLQDERLTGWSKLHLDRFEADLAAGELRTSVMEFEQLYGRLHIAEDLSTNISDLLVEPETAVATEGAAEADVIDITIGGINMNDTSLDFSDFSLPLPFAAAIRSMDGEISTLATDSSTPANVSLEGQVNEFGLARINGAINAWDPTAMTDIRMVFRNLEISRLSPYSIQFAGYAIEEGRLDLDLEYKLDQRLLKGENKVVVRDILLGEKVDHPDAGSLPLGLAVALLTDSDGVIDVELPVEGNLDDPQFRIGGVVIRALGNLITKVVTAPFRFLGSLVGVDSEDFGRVDFVPAWPRFAA